MLVCHSSLTLHEKMKWFFEAFDYNGDDLIGKNDLLLSLKAAIIGDCKVS